MITGWRHNDQNKPERVFRDEVQKEFERLYNLDGRGDAFDKAVKDAINRLLDPNNGKGFGRNGISGVNGLDGQGTGRDGVGSGSGKNGGDGKNGSGSNGSGGGGNGGGVINAPREQLTQFNVLDFERRGAIGERTSPFSTLEPTPLTAGGSGLVWIGGTSAGHYAPDQANKIAHGITSQWYRFPEKPLNEARLFATSFEWAKWTTPDNIVAEFPKAIDIDGTLKFPYVVSDVGADSFGHLQKVKITNLKQAIIDTDDPTLLEPLRLWNTGVAWYTGTDDDILFPNSNPEAKYDGRVTRWVGHGDTSNWTVGLDPGVPFNPSKNNYNPDHHFYSGDWDAPVRVNPDQINTRGTPPSYSVVTDLNMDDWGHGQYAFTNEMQKLQVGRGLEFADGHTWYNPAKPRTIQHPEKIVNHTFINAPVNSYYPIDFGIDDSGHWDSITWAQLPLMQGEKGDKGDAAILNATVISTTTLLPGSAATAMITQPPTSTPSNRFFEFSFGIPRGYDGINGIDGEDGINGISPVVSATVVSTTTLPAGSAATASVYMSGSQAFPIANFNFGIPRGADGTGTSTDPPINNYYYNTYTNNVDIQNIGSYPGSMRELVQNPGINNPFYIKRLSAGQTSDALSLGESANTILFFHKIQSLLTTGDGLWEDSGAGTVFNNARHLPFIAQSNFYPDGASLPDGYWRFPIYNITAHGHVQDVLFQDVFIGGGGGGSGSYIWNVGLQTDIDPVPNNQTVRFLSADEDKLSITKSGLDFTFSLEEALEPLIMGNGLSQDPNSAASVGLQYDPYTGLTIHVNNNTKDLAGIVKKGSDPAVVVKVKKTWGTDENDNPNWDEVVELVGSRYIDFIQIAPKKYAVTLVN